MTKWLKIVPVGEGKGVILPDDVLERLQAELGSSIGLDEEQDSFRLVRPRPDFEKVMALAEQIMREDEEILRVLAQ